jgi:hypothetical protein
MAAGIVSIPIIISGPDAFRLRRYGGGYLHMTVVLKRRIHTYDGGGEEDDAYIGRVPQCALVPLSGMRKA